MNIIPMASNKNNNSINILENNNNIYNSQNQLINNSVKIQNYSNNQFSNSMQIDNKNINNQINNSMANPITYPIVNQISGSIGDNDAAGITEIHSVKYISAGDDLKLDNNVNYAKISKFEKNNEKVVSNMAYATNDNIENNNLLMTEVKNEVTVIPKEDSKEIKFLKNKVQTLKIPLNINTIIKSELENTKTKIKKDFMKKNIEISNKKLSMNNLLKHKKKENENEVIHKINKDGIIYDIDAVTSRQLYHWKKDINFYKNELLKIETNQKIYESPSVKDMFRKKIFNDKNEQFNNQKNKIMQKIRTISEKINYILEEPKKEEDKKEEPKKE